MHLTDIRIDGPVTYIYCASKNKVKTLYNPSIAYLVVPHHSFRITKKICFFFPTVLDHLPILDWTSKQSVLLGDSKMVN